MTGVCPNECPWRAFYDPEVFEVLDAYEWFSKGQLAAYDDNPPNALIEAIGIFHSALERARAHDSDLLRKRGK